MPLASAAPGLGEDDYPGFPADDCPGELPDLSQHHSATAQVLRARPDIFAQLRGRRTKLGVGLARCIKTGMDNRGHQLVRSLGAVAGDAECYDTFAPLFDALLRDHYGCGGGELPSAPPLMSAGVPSGLTSLRPDPSGKYVLSAQVTAARCLAGARFPPAALPEDRRQVEEDLVGALLEMTGPLKGEYYPLDGSSSYASKPSGMSPAEAEELSQAGLLFGPPDSTAALCSGVGRGWPDARGVFASSSSGLSAWINEEEHLRISSVRQGAALQDAFRELAAALEAVEASLARRGGQQFARSDRLGYLTANPVNAGTGLRASVVLRLPLLTADRGHRGALSSWCAAERLYARGALCQGGSVLPGVLELSTRDRLGVSDVEAVNRAVEAAAELVRAERRLEAGQALDLHALPREGEVVLSASPSPPAGSWELAGGELGRLFALALCGEEPAAAPAVALVAPAAQEQVSRAPPAACGAALVATPPLEAKPAGARPAAHGRVAAQERPQAAAPAPASREGAKDAGCLRRELRALLVQKAATGELEAILAETVGERAAEAAEARHRARGALLLGLLGGRLAAAASEAQEQAAGDELTDSRVRVRGALEEALGDGSLEQLLRSRQRERDDAEAAAKAEENITAEDLAPEGGGGGGEAAEADDAVEEVRGLARSLLLGGLSEGTLEAALRDVAGEAQQPASSEAPLQEREAAGATTPTAALAALSLPGPVAALLGSVAASDRKIGALEATIREVEELLVSREEACAQLEREVSLARHDAACLEQEVELHRSILEEQDALWLSLHQGRRKLVDEFHAETFEHRHAALEADGLLLTGRSELSTVCTLNDVPEQQPRLDGCG